MKRKLIILTLLAGVFTFTACSDGDNDGYATILIPDDAKITPIGYLGSWSFSNSFNNNSDDSSTNSSEILRSQVNTEVSLDLIDQRLTIFDMPNDLIRHIAGWEDTATDIPPFFYGILQTTLQVKGYSSSNQIFSLNQTDYAFPFKHEDQRHDIRLGFDSTSELVYDSYTETITLVLVIKEVYLDEQLVATNPGYLMLEASRPTKSL